MRRILALCALLLTTPLLPSAVAVDVPPRAAGTVDADDACATPLGALTFAVSLPYVGLFTTAGTDRNGCHWTGFGLVSAASCSSPPIYCRYDGAWVRA